MNGQIITFYSYKGGVGRSFALANTAAVLSKWGYRILCVDWDLDAPGLGYYFAPWLDGPVAGGLVDAFTDFARSGRLDLRHWVRHVTVTETGAGFDFIPAGTGKGDYFTNAQRLDWNALYVQRDLGGQLEALRSQWMNDYDIILIDSRTGVTDIGGICTAQLPDVVVMLFTANEQSLEGTLDVAQRAHAARDKLPYDRSRLMILPVPSRFDAKEEYQRAEQWRMRISRALGDLVSPWLHREVSVANLLRHVTIPYIPYWSFGEEIAVLGPSESTPGDIGYTIVTLAALLAHGINRTELLAESRDSYVNAAVRGVQSSPAERFSFDVMLSYGRTNSDVVVSCRRLLNRQSLRVAEHSGGSTSKTVARSRHCIIIIGRDSGDRLPHEVEVFIRQSLDDSVERRIFPVVWAAEGFPSIPPALKQFQFSVARDMDELEALGLEICGQIKLLRSSEALDAAQAENTSRPRISQGLSDVARSYVLLGESSLRRSDPEEAATWYEKALTNFAAVGDLWGQAQICDRLGDIAIADGQHSRARAAYLDSLALCESLALRRPEDAWSQHALLVSNLKVGDAASIAKAWQEARSFYSSCLDIARQMLAFRPGDARRVRYLSEIYMRLGNMEERGGDLSAARDAFLARLDIGKKCTRADPENADWQRVLCDSHILLGEVASAARDWETAHGSYQAGFNIAHRMVGIKDRAEDSDWRYLFASSAGLGETANEMGDLAAARAAYEFNIELAERRLNELSHANREWQNNLLLSYIGLGDVSRAQGDTDTAHGAYRAALDVAQRLGEDTPADSLPDRRVHELRQKLREMAREHPQTRKKPAESSLLQAIRDTPVEAGTTTPDSVPLRVRGAERRTWREMGLDDVPGPQLAHLNRVLYTLLEMRVGSDLAGRMSDAQLYQFEEFVDSNHETAALGWLEANFPTYQQVVQYQYSHLMSEVHAMLPEVRRVLKERFSEDMRS